MVESHEGSRAGRVPLGVPSSFEEDLAFLVAFSERLLDLAPAAVGVFDENLCLRSANREFLALIGFDSLAEGEGVTLADHPVLRSPAPAPDALTTLGDLLSELFASERDLELPGLVIPDTRSGGSRTYLARAAAWDTEDPRFRRVLLWLKEEAPPTEEEEESEPATEALAAKTDRIFTLTALIEQLLETVPVGVCILDAMFRVRLTNRRLEDLLGVRHPPRASGDRHLFAIFPVLRDEQLLAALETCLESGSPATWEHRITLESGSAQALRTDVRRLPGEGGAEDALLIVFEGLPSEAEEIEGGEKPEAPPEEAPVAPEEPDILSALLPDEAEPVPPVEPLAAIQIGAQEPDVSLLRLLYRDERFRLRMVFDPDPDAQGLALAQSLGIPTVSGDVELSLEQPPDFVVLARPDLAGVLARLGLTGVTRVERDEVELLLVDPESFLEEKRAAGDLPRPEPAAPLEPPAPPEAREPEGQRGREVADLLTALELLLDFDLLADRLLGVALDVTGGASGSVMLLEDDERILRIVASRGLSDIVIEKARQRVGEGVAGRVAEDGKPLLLVGSIRDEHVQPVGERSELRSSVSVPVLDEGQIVGVLNVNSDPARGPFTGEELQRASDLACRLGRILRQSRQLRRIREHSFELALQADLQAIGGTRESLPAKLHQVVARVVEALSADSCQIFLIDPGAAELVLQAAAGVATLATEGVRVPVGKGVVGWVAAHHQPLMLRGSVDEDDKEGGDRPVTLGIPLHRQTDLVGVLCVEGVWGPGGAEECLAHLRSVAMPLGALIGESRLQESSERKMTMLSALAELGVAFTAAGDREALARLVAFTATTVLEADVCMLRLLREELEAGPHSSADFEVVTVHGASRPTEREPLGLLEARLVGEVVKTGEPCRDIDLALAEVEQLMRRANVATALAVPLASDAGVLGAVTVYRVLGERGPWKPFNPDEVEIGTRLAVQATAAAQRFVGGSEQAGSDFAGDEEWKGDTP
jgi:GAF domain-containing protein/PAS domain-containing protein